MLQCDKIVKIPAFLWRLAIVFPDQIVLPAL
jgi:hypothetical protein